MTQRKESIHDRYRRKKAIADAGGNYRKWEGGKGDIDRSSHTRPYQLGMELIKVEEQFGKDSPEYKKTEKAWRESIRKSR